MKPSLLCSLSKLRAQWVKNGSKGMFNEPSAYRVHIVGDKTVSTPELVRLKGLFPEWLWTVCNESLNSSNYLKLTWADRADFGPTFIGRRREAPMAEALRAFGDYPSRPSGPSFEALREILEVAPTKSMYPPKRQNPKGVDKYLFEREEFVREETDSSWRKHTTT